MNKKRMNKGQFELSFGMMFSIILIIVFLAAGFYGIKMFLDFQNNIKVGQFSSDLQDAVIKLWKGTSGTQNLIYQIPTYITAVCFRDWEYENLNFESKRIIKGTNIEHLDIAKTTQTENPLCIKNINGKVNFIIVKNYGEALVKVEREE
jgi:hypothetical protein